MNNLLPPEPTKGFPMKNIFLLLSFFSFNVFVATSQNIGEKNYQIGDSLYKNGNYEKAIERYELALTHFKSIDEWNKALEIMVDIGYALDDWGKPIDAANYIEKNLPEYEKRKSKVDPMLFAKAILTKAVTLKKSSRLAQSLQEYENAIAIYEQIGANHPNVAYAYRNAAQIYVRLLNYQKAESYYETALQKDTSNHYTASITSLLANYHFFLGKYDRALEYVEFGRSIPKRLRDSITLISVEGKIHLKKGNFQKAEYLFQTAFTLIKKHPDLHLDLWVDFSNLADVAFLQKKYDVANKYFAEALSDASKVYLIKDRELAKLHANFGLNLFQEKKYSLALSHYQQALIQLFPNFNSTNTADNPSINDIYTESWIMTASGRKGEALKYRYDLSCDTADLKNASECFDLSIAGVQALKHSYGTDAAKLYLGDYSHNYFEQAIEVNYLLYKETGGLQHLEKVFAIMEQSKATVLAEAVQKNRALLLAGIPDSLLEKEMEIRLALADLNTEIKLEELNGDEMDEERLRNLRNQQGTQQRQYESLFAQLKEQFPSFRAFVERRNVPKISDAKALANSEGAAIMQYFTGEKAVYLLVILPEKAFIFQIERTSGWDKTIENYLDFFQNNAAITSDPSGYFEAASSLYAALVPSALQGILPENLVIVPDGLLALVPFDALVAQKPKTANFTEADFLIKKYRIRYAYSAGLLLDPISIKKKKGKLLSVAPLFARQERGLSGLQYSTEETSALKKLIVLQDQYATLAHFKEMAAQSRLLHLSTHAGAADGEGIPRIEFIDTSLYLPEIYAMNLPLAELVVLSACETGLGKFEKGEGIMSLARGFAYAGANSLVASLWRVNERSTQVVKKVKFSFFHKKLSIPPTCHLFCNPLRPDNFQSCKLA